MITAIRETTQFKYAVGSKYCEIVGGHTWPLSKHEMTLQKLPYAQNCPIAEQQSANYVNAEEVETRTESTKAHVEQDRNSDKLGLRHSQQKS